MNKEKGSSVIALIAIAAIAILVGIWIGAKTDIAKIDMDTNTISSSVTKTVKKNVNTVSDIVKKK